MLFAVGGLDGRLNTVVKEMKSWQTNEIKENVAWKNRHLKFLCLIGAIFAFCLFVLSAHLASRIFINQLVSDFCQISFTFVYLEMKCKMCQCNIIHAYTWLFCIILSTYWIISIKSDLYFLMIIHFRTTTSFATSYSCGLALMLSINIINNSITLC